MAMLEPVPAASPSQGRTAGSLAPVRLRPFSTDDAGQGYFRSDYHHRYLVTAVLSELKQGKSFFLLAGEPLADGELLERFINEERGQRHRASLVRCRPGMTFADVIRTYGERLSLPPEPIGTGLWTLLSHLMREARGGLARVLILEHPEALVPGAFGELLAFTRLDQPHVMPLLLLSSSGTVDGGERSYLAALPAAATARFAVNRLEPEEVEAFLRYQLNALTAEESAAFSPETVRAITAAAGGSPATVNRLARQVLEAAAPPPPPLPAVIVPAPVPAPATVIATAAVPAPPVVIALPPAAALPAVAAPAPIPPPRHVRAEIESRAEAKAAAEAEDDGDADAEADVETEEGALRLTAALPDAPARRRWSPSAMTVGIYVASVLLCGIVLLSLLLPRVQKNATEPVALAEISPQAGTPAAESRPASPEASTAPAAANSVPAVPAVPAAPEPPPVTAAEAPPPAESAPLASAPALAPAPESAPAAQDAAPPVQDATPPAASDAQPAEEPSPSPPVPAAAAPAPASNDKQEAALPPPTQEPTPAAAPAAASAPAALAPTAAAPEKAATAAPEKAATAEVEPAPPVSAEREPPVVQSPPPAASPQPPQAAPDADSAALLRRGEQLLAAGDIVPARRFFERALPRGEAQAALGLAKSYDPLFLRQLGAVGPVGDAASAREWYRRAAAAGNPEAQARLDQLERLGAAAHGGGK